MRLPETSLQIVRRWAARWLAVVQHGWRLLRFWLRLQGILAGFIRQCPETPRSRWRVFPIAPPWRSLGQLCFPHRELDPAVLGAENRRLQRFHLRLERFCRRHPPTTHPLTNPAAIRLQAVAARNLLARGLGSPRIDP